MEQNELIAQKITETHIYRPIVVVTTAFCVPASKHELEMLFHS